MKISPIRLQPICELVQSRPLATLAASSGVIKSPVAQVSPNDQVGQDEFGFQLRIARDRHTIIFSTCTSFKV
jgi:hypothetical protein